MSRLIVVFIVVSMICGAIALSSTKMADEKEEEDEKKNPKAIAGTVIAAAELTLAVLESVLSAIGSVNRKIAIGVANESGMDWQGKNAYYHSGTSDTILPQFVPNDKALLYDGRKTHGPVATGAVGVVAYHMSDGTTLGILFSVPFDYNFYDNWWNIKIYEGKIEASEWMYEDLYYYANPFEGDNSWEYANLGEELKIAGFMTSSGEALLDIHVMRR